MILRTHVFHDTQIDQSVSENITYLVKMQTDQNQFGLILCKNLGQFDRWCQVMANTPNINRPHLPVSVLLQLCDIPNIQILLKIMTPDIQNHQLDSEYIKTVHLLFFVLKTGFNKF